MVRPLGPFHGCREPCGTIPWAAASPFRRMHLRPGRALICVRAERARTLQVNIHHMSIGVADLDRAMAFYDRVLAPLGLAREVLFTEPPDALGGLRTAGAMGVEDNVPFWLEERPGASFSCPPGFHLAFGAPDAAAVHAFHAAGLPPAAPTTARRDRGPITGQAITPLSSSTRTAGASRRWPTRPRERAASRCRWGRFAALSGFGPTPQPGVGSRMSQPDGSDEP